MKKNVFKKLIGKKSTGIIVAIIAFAIVFGAIFSVSNLTLAKDTLPGIGDIRNYIAGDANAYKVLEIVPTLEAAEFGFLVGGEEPFDANNLYDDVNKNWITWQEYLASKIDTMDTTARVTYMQELRLKNAAYITEDATDLSKPILYKPYTEDGITAEDADGVFKGGSIPVKGWLTADDTRGSGWNAKFTNVDATTYEPWINGTETIPYYIETETIQLTADIVNADPATYLDHFYTYKRDMSLNFFVPSITFGELKTGIASGTIAEGEIGDYYIIKFGAYHGQNRH